MRSINQLEMDGFWNNSQLQLKLYTARYAFKRNTRLTMGLTCLVLLTLSAMVRSVQRPTCQYSREELSSMDVHDALEILLDFYDETCPIHSSNGNNGMLPHVHKNNGIEHQKEADYYAEISSYYASHNVTHKITEAKGLDRNERTLNQFELLTQLYDSLDGDIWYNNYGWKDKSVPICNWFGVYCLYSCSSDDRLNNTCPVMIISLPYNNLYGDVDAVCSILEQFKFLEQYNFASNKIYGKLPDFNFPNLVTLYISDNQLTGTIPDFHNIPNIKTLEIYENKLEGTIPDFTGLSMVNLLSIGGSNKLIGTVPNFTQLPSMMTIQIVGTKVHGTVPDFDKMPLLETINLNNNQLIGTIPNFSSTRLMKWIYMSNNQISGTVPSFKNFPDIETIYLPDNQLNGTIPNFNSFVVVQYIILSNNQLTGTIPNFYNLHAIYEINLSNNQLTGTLPNLNEFHDIWTLDLSSNKLNGTLPNFSTALSIKTINLSGNRLSGTIPNFSDKINVGSINLSNNSLTGTVPSLTNNGNIKTINLSRNQLNGTIPNFSNVSNIEIINLSSNQLSGTIPDFGGIPMVQQLDFSSNNLTGNVPVLGTLTRLQALYLGNNKLTGITKLSVKSLLTLSFENNRIRGVFHNFGGCPSLIQIIASGNLFTKMVLVSPSSLQVLDLSRNQLTGTAPNFKNQFLTELDLSFNNLTDPLPAWSALKGLKRLDLYGNEYLSGPLPSGMNTFNGITILSTLKTNMRAASGAEKLLPDVLSFSDAYRIEKIEDNYQCPVVANLNVGYSMIEINSTYYSRIKCKCLPGYFGYGDRCVRCPNECECIDGITLNSCFASPNVKEIKSIIPCPLPDSCKASISEKVTNTNTTNNIEKLCEVGYENRVCSKCQDGYGRQGRSCIKCKTETIYLTLAAVLVAFFLFLVYLYRSDTSKSAKIRIIMLHMQTLSIISPGLIQSDSTNEFIDISSSIGSIQLPNVSCVHGLNDVFDIVIFSFARIPILIIIGSIVYFLGSYHQRNKVVFITLIMLFFIYYSIAREVFGVFGCTVYDDGEDIWYLNSMPWIRCSPTSSEYEKLLGISIPVSILFLVGLPVFVWYKVRDSIHDSDVETEERYGFLYLPYKETYHYWEFVIIIRRIAFSFIISVVPYTNLTVFFLLLVIIIQGSIWLQQKYRPYVSDIENKMEISSLYVTFVSFFLALLSSSLGSQAWISILMVALNITWLAFFTTLVFLVPFFEEYGTMKSFQMRTLRAILGKSGDYDPYLE